MKIEVLYPEICNLYGYLQNIEYLRRSLKLNGAEVEIIDKMQSLCPDKRPSCEELLNNDYFKNNVISNEELKFKLNIF